MLSRVLSQAHYHYLMKLFEKFCVEDCKLPIVVVYFIVAAAGAFGVCLGVDVLRRLALAGGRGIG